MKNKKKIIIIKNIEPPIDFVNEAVLNNWIEKKTNKKKTNTIKKKPVHHHHLHHYPALNHQEIIARDHDLFLLAIYFFF